MEKTISEIFSLNRTLLEFDKSKIPAKTLIKIGVIGTLVFVITLLHYQTAPDAGIRHVIFRELYFLPIILAGFWFGMRGGLATSLVISLLYGPLVLTSSDKFSAHDIGNIMEIFLFNLIGGLLGWLKDREAAQQAKARQAEGLAAMGRAAAMIAHDLRTPLVTIGGLARRLTGKVSPDTPEGEKVMVIRQQAERLEQLVMDILFFARPMKLSSQPSNLCHLLHEAKEAVNEIARVNGIKIDIPAEETCDCYLDYGKMMQVFVNLLNNAIEVSTRGGTVKVSLHRHADKLQIDVADRGTGIPDNIAGKIFEPFVTGKKKGTGLGLPISKKIVEAHAGKLEYKNNTNAGITFRVSIPTKL
jgi:signal transduction histidine kinase